jgi:hypothetical protein
MARAPRTNRSNTRERARTREASKKARQKTEICRRLIEGESLRSITRDEHMPANSTVAVWVQSDPVFASEYAAARLLQADALADEVVDIADKAHDRDTAAAARVKIDARKWMAGKLAPKRYGDAVQLKHADAEGDRLYERSADNALMLADILLAIGNRERRS